MTAGAVAVAVTLLIFAGALLRGLEESTITVQTKTDTGLARLAAPGYFTQDREWSVDLLLEGTGPLEAHLRQGFPSMRIAPRVSFRADVSDGQFSARARGVGIRVPEYFDAFHLALTAGGLTLEAAHAGEVPAWMGAGLARDFGATVGQPFMVTGRTRHGSHTAQQAVLAGIVETGNPVVDFASVFLPLDAVQALLDMPGAVTELVAQGSDRGQAAAWVAWAKRGPAAVDAKDWWEESEPIRELNGVRRRVFSVILTALMVMAAAGIANTMLMACFERAREIGMMKALGLSTPKVVRLILAEGALVGAVGAAVGWGVGGAVTRWLEVRGVDLGDLFAGGGASTSMASKIFFAPTAGFALLAVGLGLAIALLASWYPARRFARLPPLEAMK